MHESLWSNDELRTFLTALRDSSCFTPGTEVDDVDRGRFLRQAMLRVVPEVERRLLADVGATVDSRGIAAVTLELVEDGMWGRRHTWLMVTSEPWAFLADQVTREIRSAYRASVRVRDDQKALKGIAAVSSRAELGAARDSDGAGESEG